MLETKTKLIIRFAIATAAAPLFLVCFVPAEVGNISLASSVTISSDQSKAIAYTAIAFYALSLVMLLLTSLYFAFTKGLNTTLNRMMFSSMLYFSLNPLFNILSITVSEGAACTFMACMVCGAIYSLVMWLVYFSMVVAEITFFKLNSLDALRFLEKYMHICVVLFSVIPIFTIPLTGSGGKVGTVCTIKPAAMRIAQMASVMAAACLYIFVMFVLTICRLYRSYKHFKENESNKAQFNLGVKLCFTLFAILFFCSGVVANSFEALVANKSTLASVVLYQLCASLYGTLLAILWIMLYRRPQKNSTEQ